MPSFSYTKVKWPAEYHPELLPDWATAKIRAACARAVRVKVSTDRSVVVVTDEHGTNTRLTERDA